MKSVERCLHKGARGLTYEARRHCALLRAKTAAESDSTPTLKQASAELIVPPLAPVSGHNMDHATVHFTLTIIAHMNVSTCRKNSFSQMCGCRRLAERIVVCSTTKP